MIYGKLNIYKSPKLNTPRLLMGLSGWMDGGEVSTGTIKGLIEKFNARKFAEIQPEGFYIYNFPGSMEVSSLFRPHTKIKDGLIESYEPPRNTFFYNEENNLILLSGKEPNLKWQEFGDCIFRLCLEFGVREVYFIGSVSGLVPHTREPRIFCSVSEAKLKESLGRYGLKFSEYEGPASIVTYLTSSVSEHGLSMASLVAAVPVYVQGNNPICIEAVTRRLGGILGLHIELDELRKSSSQFEKKLSDVVQDQPELAATMIMSQS